MHPRKAIPQTIQIYLPQGDPAGIRMAEITTRTVRLFEVPRTLLSDFRVMPESKQVGVYFLFGSSPEGRPMAYIGQSGSVGGRILDHDMKKEWWDKALIAVSLTNSWTSTHVSYMEYLEERLRTHLPADRRPEAARRLTSVEGPNPLRPECLISTSATRMRTSLLVGTDGHRGGTSWTVLGSEKSMGGRSWSPEPCGTWEGLLGEVEVTASPSSR
jgi:hypothetical protein